MNDKIKQLAEQADELADNEIQMPGEYHPDWHTIRDKKFAELIVKECIDKIQNYDLVPGHSAKWEDIYDIHARLLDDLGEELKEHFGVEL
jgi:hypothetical protein